MRRSNSYSLQKINPNLISQRNNSRIVGPKDRLNFPPVGDSAYYGGVGKKHYQKSTQFIHKLILNPDYGNPNQRLPRSNSEHYFKYTPSSVNQQNAKVEKKQTKEPIDSLAILEKQISKKLMTEVSPSKSPYKIDEQSGYYSQVPHRKHSYDSPAIGYKSNPFKIFDGIDKMYQIVHQHPPNNNQSEQTDNAKRKFNPTYLSSGLGYV